MRIAFVLYKYLPYSGLAQDFLRIASLIAKPDNHLDVYVMEWRGDADPRFNVHVISPKGWTNHGKAASFYKKLSTKLVREKYNCVVGFNKMPMLDVYFAADTCYLERFENTSFWHRLNPRFRLYSRFERAVFGKESRTICLMISDAQTEQFKKIYGIKDERLIILPPGIDTKYRRPTNGVSIRKKFRAEYNLTDNDELILMVGTGFKTKGLDRAIMAMAALPPPIKKHTYLMVVGEGDNSGYKRLAEAKGIPGKVLFMGGRSDVVNCLLGADFLLHPSRRESAGKVILEAIVAGLPVLVTGICGYARHVKQSQAGLVLDEPFSQENLNEKLVKMISFNKEKWVRNALDYADIEDLYSMSEKAADVIEQAARKQ